MTEQEQIRDNMKTELEKNRSAMLKNMKDTKLGEQLMKEFTELTLFITSFEFTQKIIEDPEFMQQAMEQIKKDE